MLNFLKTNWESLTFALLAVGFVAITQTVQRGDAEGRESQVMKAGICNSERQGEIFCGIVRDQD